MFEEIGPGFQQENTNKLKYSVIPKSNHMGNKIVSKINPKNTTNDSSNVPLKIPKKRSTISLNGSRIAADTINNMNNIPHIIG
jgi:hypothetical protein